VAAHVVRARFWAFLIRWSMVGLQRGMPAPPSDSESLGNLGPGLVRRSVPNVAQTRKVRFVPTTTHSMGWAERRKRPFFILFLCVSGRASDRDMPAYSLLRWAFEESVRQNPNTSPLSWYLAAEIANRFYCSHGVRPVVIEYPFGFYGISIQKVGCPIRNGKAKSLGRMTIMGDVENWVTSSPGDHGLALARRFAEGEPVDGMLAEAIRFLGLSPFPSTSHNNCRHKRWGESYCLLFRLMALLAMKNEISVTNGESAYEQGAPIDPKASMKDHPGYFRVGKVIVRGDGIVLSPAGQGSVWEKWMSGTGEQELMEWLREIGSEGKP
jgi:hypothetical protein